MTVAAILADKGREVITVRPTTAVVEAVEVLARHKIGAVVVIDDSETPVGIFSERDVVRALGKYGADALGLAVSTVMTGKVLTCSESDTIDQVMGQMTHGRFRHLPVLLDERLVGIVSIGDVVKRRIEDVEREAEHMRTYIATA